MQLLDAVNLVLPKLGERPVTTLSAQHPTLAVLLPVFEQVRRTVLGRGWWFNEYQTTLYPASDGTVAVGDDTITFLPDLHHHAIQRGKSLFNIETLTYVFNNAVTGRLTTDVPFDELPESAANYVMHTALVEVYATDIGMSQELQVWSAMAAQAWSDMLAEHLRQRRRGTRNTRHWRNIVRAIKGG